MPTLRLPFVGMPVSKYPPLESTYSSLVYQLGNSMSVPIGVEDFTLTPFIDNEEMLLPSNINLLTSLLFIFNEIPA